MSTALVLKIGAVLLAAGGAVTVLVYTQSAPARPAVQPQAIQPLTAHQKEWLDSMKTVVSRRKQTMK